MLKSALKFSRSGLRHTAALMLVVAGALSLEACNFVDPGEKTTVPFGSNELRLPIYQNGDFLRYDVDGSIAVGNQLPINAKGTLSVSYSVAADNVLPTDLGTPIDPTKVLKETITLTLGQQFSSERFIYQEQDDTSPLYGTLYLVAISNQNSSNKKYSWPGQSNLISPQPVMRPVVFANVYNGNLDPVNFELYVDCDSSGVITTSCSNQWLTYSETPQLTNVGNNNYGYFYHEKTYLTAAITKSLWNVTFQNQTYIDAAKAEGLSASELDSHVFCATVPSTGASASGNGQYFYLNQVGVVTMSNINCLYSADASGTSQQITLNLVLLNDARVGGVNLNDIL